MVEMGLAPHHPFLAFPLSFFLLLSLFFFAFRHQHHINFNTMTIFIVHFYTKSAYTRSYSFTLAIGGVQLLLVSSS